MIETVNAVDVDPRGYIPIVCYPLFEQVNVEIVANSPDLRGCAPK